MYAKLRINLQRDVNLVGSTNTLDRVGSGLGGCLDGGGPVPPVVPQPPGLSPLHQEVITPKKQAVVDRLRRRLESYRRRQTDCMPRFDQSFSGLCEQNIQETLQLKQRYLDAKAKRPPKAKDKKQPDQTVGQQQSASIQSSVHVQQKFLKRSAGEELDPSGGPQGDSNSYEPPVKLQCTTQQHGNQNEGITKFSLEIVQQLEFTTSAANSQPQQISTNVTVKAHTNASVKSDVSSPKSSNPSTPSSNLQQQQQSKSNIGLDVGTLVECVKQEPDNDFADLDQCAAALEKDAAANGGAFGGFSDLIGDDTNDEIITSDAFNDLISDISNYPELMKDFDFEDNKPESSASANGLKVEDVKDTQQNVQQGVANPSDPIKNTHSPLIQNHNNYSPSPVFDGQNHQPVPNKNNSRMVYPNLDFTKTELSPAAQTLKQMAEQHQHKNQMGLTYNPNNRVPNARSPYSDFQYNTDYGSPTSNQQFKNSPNFPQPDLIKQEMIFQGNEFDAMKRKAPGMYKQQYSPYSSPSHGSPGYLPRTNSGTSGGSTPGGPFGGGTPPRPPSGHGGGGTGPTLQINQAQQLHISQQGHGHSIQVSAGQHLQLSGELKGNVSIATHQGLHFNQQHTSSNNASAQQPQSQSQGGGQQNQMPSHQQSQMGGNSTQNVQNPHGNINMSQQQSQSSMSNSMNNPMMSNAQQQQIPTAQHMGSQQGPMGNSMQNGGMQGMQGMGNPGMQSSIQGPGGNMQSGIQNSASMSGGSMQGSLGGMGGNNMMGGSPLHPGSMSSLSENYSMSQSQTINFTQQNLRQRGNGGPGTSDLVNIGNRYNMPRNSRPTAMGTPMSGNPTMNPMSAQMGAARMMNQQQQAVLEQQQKLMQQQMLRNQQQQQHQQAAAAAAMQQHMVRPPPPEYKASAGMMQPRYGAGMRRMPHQPIPPSGPMMRPHNVYMLQQQQQQHLATRNIYPRQQNPMTSSIEALQQKTEWRHILLSQQQNTNFNNQMRPQFQQGFNMNPAANNIQQMTALQHQQMRMQQSLTPSGISSGGQPMGQAQVMNQGPGSGPMSQLGGMNQQMQLMQQQNLMQQQQNSQLSMTNIHMQQSQSLSLNQSLQQHQQQNNMNLVNNSSAATNSLASFNPQAADFNLEFLDNLSTSDSAPFSEQELLSSFDTDSGFNLDF